MPESGKPAVISIEATRGGAGVKLALRKPPEGSINLEVRRLYGAEVTVANWDDCEVIFNDAPDSDVTVIDSVWDDLGPGNMYREGLWYFGARSIQEAGFDQSDVFRISLDVTRRIEKVVQKKYKDYIIGAFARLSAQFDDGSVACPFDFDEDTFPITVLSSLPMQDSMPMFPCVTVHEDSVTESERYANNYWQTGDDGKEYLLFVDDRIYTIIGYGRDDRERCALANFVDMAIDFYRDTLELAGIHNIGRSQTEEERYNFDDIATFYSITSMTCQTERVYTSEPPAPEYDRGYDGNVKYQEFNGSKAGDND